MVPEVVQAAPATLSLVFGAAVIWVVVSILMGLAAAVFKGTLIDPILMILALIGISMPVFWVGELANLITQSRWHDTFLFHWVPPLGYTPFTQDPGLVVQGARDPLDHALDRCSSGSTRACSARACSRCRARTTCGRRGRRGSPSGGCSCGIRCGRP